jgi:hypothetical protein
MNEIDELIFVPIYHNDYHHVDVSNTTLSNGRVIVNVQFFGNLYDFTREYIYKEYFAVWIGNGKEPPERPSCSEIVEDEESEGVWWAKFETLEAAYKYAISERIQP